MPGKAIVKKAIRARTLQDAEELQTMIEAEIGNRFQRPVGDRWKNSGMFSGGGGSYDHKIIENATNMQDTVIELAALRKFGSFDKVPYSKPHDAAEDLFNGKDVSENLFVQFEESDPPAKETKRITAIFRDHGCGMTPAEIPETIFGLGSSYKDEINWLQGAFGMGGKVTYRNSKAIVIATRKAPDLLSEGEEDLISIAVLFWETHNKTQSLYYLVTSKWERQGDTAYPFSISAGDFPEFQPGTHLALISYGVEGLYRGRGGGDDRTFEAIFNTRVFRPVLPIKFTNKIIPGREKRRDILKGLKRRLEDNPYPGRREGREILPYNYEGITYHLPVSYYVFPKRGDRGERRNFVAYNHAVVFTSNGQVHSHWSPAEFKNKTSLNKLYDRIFVEVETDELPIELRTALFTMERTDMVKTDAAIKLKNDVAGLLDDPDGELKEINNDIIKEAILAKRDDSRPTINIARQISRALKMRGFSLGAVGESGGGGKRGGGGRKTKAMELYNDPTTLEGPSHIKAEEGKTKFTTYWINAVDDFIPKRGQLTVTCDHRDINDKEITIGSLRKGRIKVSIAIPDDADKGEFKLIVELKDWLRSSGGVGAPLKCATTFEIVEEGSLKRLGSGKEKGKEGGMEGALVGLLWKSHEDEEHSDWEKNTVGEVGPVPAEILAEAHDDYKTLAKLGGTPITTIQLNQAYYGLKKYVAARARTITPDGIEAIRSRYAVGTGVGLCMIYNEQERRKEKGETLSDDWVIKTHEALSRSVLSMLPEFDKLTREAGMEDV